MIGVLGFYSGEGAGNFSLHHRVQNGSGVTVILKEPFLGGRNNYEGRLKSSRTRLIRKRDRHSRSTKFRFGVIMLGTKTTPLLLGITVTVSLCITAAHCRQSTNFANGPRTKAFIIQRQHRWKSVYVTSAFIQRIKIIIIHVV
jgi:hypothetical protein